MKKILIISAVVAGLFVVVAGSLGVYVYTRDLGTEYNGRARLDYNWKYYFTACPKEEYKYAGKYFSFSYPKFEKENTLRESTETSHGWVFDTHHRMSIQWNKTPEKGIKSELSGYLSSPAGQVIPSAEFMRWLVGSGPKVSVYIERVALKNGNAAVIISGRGKDHGYVPGLEADLGHKYVFLAGLTPGGTIFHVEIYSPSNLSETLYREQLKYSSGKWYQYPSPDTYAESACLLDRFLKTFEIKKL